MTPAAGVQGFRFRRVLSILCSRREALLLVLSATVLGGCADRVESAAQSTPTSEPKKALPTPTPTAEPTRTPTPQPMRTPGPTPTSSPEPLIELLSSYELDVSQLPNPPRLPPERILIPRVAIDAKIVRIETKLNEKSFVVWETAAFAVGHHRGSANPGERGNIVLSGHLTSVREGAVFKRLPEVVVDDGVILTTAEQNYLYRVVQTIVVEPQRVDVIKPTADETVTLITCVPPGVFSHRLVVTARRVQ